jgi:hypothetical protein
MIRGFFRCVAHVWLRWHRADGVRLDGKLVRLTCATCGRVFYDYWSDDA